MADYTMTVSVRQTTFDQLSQRAEDHQQTVEDELRQTVERALANGTSRLDDGVPTLDVLGLLQNEQLRQIAEREPAAESVLLLRALHQKRDTAGLTDDEEALARDLVQSYDRAVLVRSRALLLLHQRGEDISALVGGA